MIKKKLSSEFTKIEYFSVAHVDLRRHPRMSSDGFTFIEILITLAIIGILFIPVMQMFSFSVSSSTSTRDLITALNLGKWGMERMKNLSVTKKELTEMGDLIYPSQDKEPLEINNTKWRIVREIFEGTDPLEVRVHVYSVTKLELERYQTEGFQYGQEDEMKPLVTLVTLVEDFHWEVVENIQ